MIVVQDRTGRIVRTEVCGRDLELLDIVQSVELDDGSQTEAWPSSLRVEFHRHDDKTRLVVREGPHLPGMAELGRQAWETMLPKLESLLGR
jgi:hypothetical protein